MKDKIKEKISDIRDYKFNKEDRSLTYYRKLYADKEAKTIFKDFNSKLKETAAFDVSRLKQTQEYKNDTFFGRISSLSKETLKSVKDTYESYKLDNNRKQ